MSVLGSTALWVGRDQQDGAALLRETCLAHAHPTCSGWGGSSPETAPCSCAASSCARSSAATEAGCRGREAPATPPLSSGAEIGVGPASAGPPPETLPRGRLHSWLAASNRPAPGGSRLSPALQPSKGVREMGGETQVERRPDMPLHLKTPSALVEQQV